MPRRRVTALLRPLLVAGVLGGLVQLWLLANHQREWTLPAPETVSEGVTLYRLEDATLVSPPAPTVVHLVRLDPGKVRLASALASGEVAGLDTVPSVAARLGAEVAINGGYFLASGDPAGVLKVSGELVSDSSLGRGAVAISESRSGRVALVFDRVSVSVSIRFTDGERDHVVPVRGVDTTRRIGHLMLYTPGYHEHTDTAPTGTEWVLRGSPLVVTDRRHLAGKTPIPADGVVLSFGGTDLPESLRALEVGTTVRVHEQFEPEVSASDAWARAHHIVGGAGLLVRNGQVVTTWESERLGATFATERHPRTMIGRDRDEAIWLVTVDGRNPDFSVGMTFSEMQGLAARLGLTDALNLDGGNSTTLVVNGRIVNRPSDPSGPRKVSDALVVLPRRSVTR